MVRYSRGWARARAGGWFMSVRLPALLAVALAVGCNHHGYARKDPPRTPPPPRDPAAAQAPTGLAPLPKPSAGTVAPPTSDALARDLPPMPGEPAPAITPAGAVGELAAL